MIAVLAHQGGWDEILLVGAPIVVIIGLLTVAKRRADAALADARTDAEIDDESAGRPAER